MVTPSALESGLAKLRECADKTMFAEVTHEEAAALLAKIEAAGTAARCEAREGRDMSAIKNGAALSEGEDIMVNTPYDVFILPLRPSGFGGKGPRFVVHVPETKPAAVDEAAANAFEEHFQASSDDPYFEGELELWLTAWRKALVTQQPGVCPNCDGTKKLHGTNPCRACNGTGQQPAQPESDPMHSLIAEGREYAEHLVAEGIGGHSIVSELTHEVSRLQSALAAAQQRIAALHAALRTYGWHKPECDYMQEELPCTCGFLTAVERDFQENSNG